MQDGMHRLQEFQMKDKPDYGYDSYKGTGKLKDLVIPCDNC